MVFLQLVVIFLGFRRILLALLLAGRAAEA